jgi:Zn-dependent M28 family amino/carboxypeptidase
MRFVVGLFLLSSALASHCAQAAPAPVFKAERISDDIRILASDEFEGRSPATKGETLTTAYLIKQFTQAGLKPGGEIVKGHRRWTQDVPLQHATFLTTPQASLSGLGPLVQRKDIAIRPPQHGGASYQITGAPLVFVGYGVAAPELGWDDFKGLDLKGKVAVVLVNDPDFEDADCKLGCAFGGKAMTYYGRWTYKYEEMARRGAAGVLVVHEDKPAAYGWATVAGSNTFDSFDILRKTPIAAHTPLEGWITRDTVLALFKASGLDFEAAKAKAMTREFTPVTLTPTFSASYSARVEVIHSKNVVALVQGKQRPHETVLYSAHWDHLGIGDPDAHGDRIANGAKDNAAGTALLLELARAWAKAPAPARSVAFLAVTGEERGLLGSEYYGQNPLYPLATTAGAINLDGGFNVLGSTRDFTVKGLAKNGLLEMLIAQGKAYGLRYTPEAHPEAGTFYRSDHFSFAKVGVPALSYDPGLDMVDGGTPRGEALRADYLSKRYHQNGDEWSRAWTYDSAQQTLTMIYAVGRQLADGHDWPQWASDSEFAARRAQSAKLRQ